MYGTSGDFNTEGKSKVTLEPGIYANGEIVEVKSGESTYQDKITQNITIVFQDAEGNKHYDERKEPADAAKSGPSYFEALLHILSRYSTEAEVAAYKAMNFPDFNSLRGWFVTTLSSKMKNVKIKFKICGSVYEGKAFTKIPNYSKAYTVPFIQTMASGKELAFTTNEKVQNAEYNAKVNAEVAKPDNDGGGNGGEKSEEVFK